MFTSRPKHPSKVTMTKKSEIRFASFFAGIGGFDLGFQNAGLIPAFHCEIDPHCQKVLKKHWPDVPLHGDIKTLKNYEIPKTEVWAAGWPCQDLSHANKDREGLKGGRSGLFYEFIALAKKAQPRWLVLENVVGLLSAEEGFAFEEVINQLEEIGYMGAWFSCNTLDAGLPHHRERVFFVASNRQEAAFKFISLACEYYRDSSPGEASRENSGPSVRNGPESESFLLVQRRGGFGYTKAKNISPTIRAQTGGHQGGHSDRPILCSQKLNLGRVREANGVSRGMDGRRGRLIGNAVSPKISEWIGATILKAETLR